MVDMATTVIIPARNEEATIGPIIHAFQQHPRTKDRVYVGVDAATTDDTAQRVRFARGVPMLLRGTYGKGQVVARAIHVLRVAKLLTRRIILCDGDYTGLTPDHVNLILSRGTKMTIGMPDWPDIPVPDHVTKAWPNVSGFRCIPWDLVPKDAHGYLLETQLNIAAHKAHMSVKAVAMPGLKSPFQWPLAAKRMAELQRDKEWGALHGVL